MGVVILSTVVFILSTLPELTDDIDMISTSNTTDSKGGGSDQPVERWEDVSRHLQRLVRSHQHLQSQLSLYTSHSVVMSVQGIIALQVLDHLTMVFFTLGK